MSYTVCICVHYIGIQYRQGQCFVLLVQQKAPSDKRIILCFVTENALCTYIVVAGVRINVLIAVAPPFYMPYVHA